MSVRLPYAIVLNAIGYYLEHDAAQRGPAAQDVFVTELADGYLVGFLDGDAQRVVPLEAPELERLQTEAARAKGGGLFRKREDGGTARARLRAAGSYLDGRQAAAILVQERQDGYSVEFTGMPNRQGDALEIVRLHEILAP